jgi:antitoxin component of MazEF toxin-antitoxin module
MNNRATIARWGNSKAVRIPTEILRKTGLELRDKVVFSVQPDGVLMRKCLSTTKGFRDFRGAIRADELRALEEALVDTERIDADEW